MVLIALIEAKDPISTPSCQTNPLSICLDSESARPVIKHPLRKATDAWNNLFPAH